MLTYYPSPSASTVLLDDAVAVYHPDGLCVVSGPAALTAFRLTASQPGSSVDLTQRAHQPPGDTQDALDALVRAGALVACEAPLTPTACALWARVGASESVAAALAAQPLAFLGDASARKVVHEALRPWGLSLHAPDAYPTPLTIVVAPCLDALARAGRLAVRGGARAVLAIRPDSRGTYVGVVEDAVTLRALALRAHLMRPAPPPDAPCVLSPADACVIADTLATTLAHGGDRATWTRIERGQTVQTHPIVLSRPLHPSSIATHPLDQTTTAMPSPLGLLDPETGLAYGARVVTRLGPAVAAAVRFRFPTASTDAASVIEQERHAAGGKGWSAEAAIASALWETAERLSGVRHDGLETRVTTAARLGSAAILPEAMDLFSEAQRSEGTPPTAAPEATVPDRLDPDRAIEWVRAWSLRPGQPHRWVPAAAAFYGVSRTDHAYAFAHSNGCAGGRTYAEAATSAILERIERDAVSLWFYNRLLRPVVDIEKMPRLVAVRDALQDIGRTVYVLDLTHDLRVPVCAAVSRRTDGPPGWVLGFSAAASLDEAAHDAVLELSQMVRATGDERHPSPLPWADTALARDHPYLVPQAVARVPPVPLGSEPLADLVARLDASGVPAYLVDQTHPMIGTPVVRAVTPGLLFFWRRLGGDRHAHVPDALGWATSDCSEGRWNPLDLFL